MADTSKEVEMMQKHLLDLANRSYQQNVFTFSDFLGESDQDAFFAIQRQLGSQHYELFGGNENCIRKMIRFGNPEDFGYEVEYPIVLLEMRPLMQKFADKFSHRDFLGALMNLGIDRSCLGDIFVEDNVGYVYCTDTIAPFLIESLDKVKHTQIRTKEAVNKTFAQEAPVEERVLVSSERIDGCISKLYNLSRSESLEYFRAGKVRVNGRLCESNSYILKADDAVSVRGFGKFIYTGHASENKKGKLWLTLLVYRQKK